MASKKKNINKKIINKKPKPKKEKKETPIIVKKPKRKKGDNYFGREEEEAVVKYLTSDNESEKNRIYVEKLRYPFERMVELIIKKYKLYRNGFTINEQIDDTLSFLFTKASKFVPSKNKKAYSYYGTISKNYNLGLVQKERKQLILTASYEENHEEINERSDLSYTIEDITTNLNYSIETLIKKITDNIKKELIINESINNKKKLTDNEKSVGNALIEILNNWELLIGSFDGSPKFNKISILEMMRNITNLNTKDIRLAMKKYKEMYILTKQMGIDNDD